MPDKKLLNKIKKSGYRKGFIAAKLNLSPCEFSNLIHGKRDYIGKMDELKELLEELCKN